MSDIIDRIKGAAGKLVLAKSDTEKLAQIRSEIGEAEVELKRLDEERGRWIVGQVAGEPDAIAAIMPADRDATALRRRLTNPRQAEAALVDATQQAEAALVEQEAQSRRRDQAEPAAECSITHARSTPLPTHWRQQLRCAAARSGALGAGGA